MNIIFEFLILSGLGVFVYGVALISEPFAFMAGGLILALYGLVGAFQLGGKPKAENGGGR